MSALRRLVVVDPAFSQLAPLLQALSTQPTVDVLVVASGQDVLAQVAVQLAGADYEALGLVGVVRQGSLSLSGLVLEAAQLASQGAVLAQIGAQLQGGGIALFGCAVDPAGEDQTAAEALAAQTGVAVQVFDIRTLAALDAAAGSDSSGGEVPVVELAGSMAAASQVALDGLAADGLVVGNAAPSAVVPLGNWGRPVITDRKSVV
jgi:hypothetical protein